MRALLLVLSLCACGPRSAAPPVPPRSPISLTYLGVDEDAREEQAANATTAADSPDPPHTPSPAVDWPTSEDPRNATVPSPIVLTPSSIEAQTNGILAQPFEPSR